VPQTCRSSRKWNLANPKKCQIPKGLFIRFAKFHFQVLFGSLKNDIYLFKSGYSFLFIQGGLGLTIPAQGLQDFNPNMKHETYVHTNISSQTAIWGYTEPNQNVKRHILLEVIPAVNHVLPMLFFTFSHKYLQAGLIVLSFYYQTSVKYPKTTQPIYF
jgi:hypothetical protein